MASLVLGAAGASIGSSLLGGGFSLLGATITGAQIGGAIGSFIGTQIDQALMPGQHVTRNGPRLSDVNIQASTEGAPIPRLYGRTRVAGQLIWASQFKETPVTTTSGGGKGGGSATITETDYTYSISFAVGLCAGEATRVGRVWANGTPLDLAPLTTRFYGGSESQNADPLIAEIDGDTPAYRGLAYMVFEDMPLAAFGNRIPQLQFEVIRAIGHDNPASLENLLTGAALIPGAGEFVYATDTVTADDGQGGSTVQNVHGVSTMADIDASLDDLQALAPNLKTVSLVVGWFGDDLRAGSIAIKPGVEALAKTTYPDSWSVNGVARADAHLVSTIAGVPAYGGTPSDASVVQAIRDLKARGLSVLFYPFLFMDIAAGNTLTDPYGGAAQSAYPWRGRITCSPAPGRSGSPDKSAAAASQVAAFFGTATAADFSVTGTGVAWTGGADWGWRRMVLHYAKLCAAAGGVDAFLIGSELRGLTQVRASASDYPAVTALKALAGDVRAILGADVKISYGADWSEYANHQTGDAPGAVLFNLDPLWSDANIDFVGIDNYLPLADWREGTAHRDYDAVHGPVSIYDPAYLAANIRGGEDYDWYYASAADRDSQTRTAITDGLGKPWVFRAKDFWNWWANPHYDRPLGSESAAPTGWTAQSKPIRFTELGCPAIDKGANQPNVFFDPKSSESAFPYYSRGTRDDLIQRRFLEAHLSFWRTPANNPVSGVYGAPMLDGANTALWCWDARPFPYFPALANVWGDSADYARGHWLNGRLGTVALPDLVQALCADAGFSACDVSDLDGLVTGFAVTGTMSPRDAIAPLASAYFFDGVESQGAIKFLSRGRAVPLAVAEDALVLPAGDAAFGYSFTRAQETDLPQVSRITYIDGDNDYSQASAEARRLIGGSSRVASSASPLVMDQGQAVAIGQRLLQDAWVMREAAQFSLPPSQIAADPADEILLQAGGRAHRLRITQIDDGAARAIQGVATDPSIYAQIGGPARTPALSQMPVQTGRAVLEFLDLPLLGESDKAWAPHLAAFARPWPGQVLLLRSAGDADFLLDTALTRPAAIGVTLSDFYSGPTARWDNGNELYVQLYGGALSSADDLMVLGGANAIALCNAAGQWEILQFADAALLDVGKYKLSRLLRGQRGSEGAMADPVAAGARVVVLDGAVLQSSLAQGQYALPFNYLWGPAGKAISDPAWQSANRQFSGVGLRPFSVCHVGFAWNGADLAIAWMRRDRDPAADNWDQSEIPMSETREAYDLEILDAGGIAVLRTYGDLTAPGAVYTAAQQAADFPGGLPNPLRVNIYQLSAVFGRGQIKSHALYTR
jgi:hypothetical protein